MLLWLGFFGRSSMCIIMVWWLLLDYILFQPGVTGPRCDQCAAGRFNLDANNPDGCSECWCNDLSDTCDSGNKYWYETWLDDKIPFVLTQYIKLELVATKIWMLFMTGQKIKHKD